MFGLLYRLIIFILLVWLAKVVITVVLRMFGPGSDRTRIHRGPAAPPETHEPEVPEEDIIDVSYTEVDPKKSEAGKK